MVERFVDDLFELDPSDFEILMYLHLILVGNGIYPKTSCHLTYTSKNFSDNYLDLAQSSDPKGYPEMGMKNIPNRSMHALM
jgi:hypothetical protein